MEGEVEITVRQVLDSPTKCLGEKFKPGALYRISAPVNVGILQDQGWQVVLPKIVSHYGDQYVLMERDLDPETREELPE